MTKIAAYGTWPSPISAADVASGKIRLSFPSVVAGEVWWAEGRPGEGGRTTVLARTSPAGLVRELVPAPYNARTRVHEYGGRSYLPVPAGTAFDIVFANFADQRLYRAAAGDGPFEPVPLTPEPASPQGLRYADLVLSPDGTEAWCVREEHAAGAGEAGPGQTGADEAGPGPITRAIVAVPLDGSAASDPAKVRVLVTGADFFAFPAPSPDGTRIAWVSWDHPRMPWDGTELRVGPATGTTVAASELVMGGPQESLAGPSWAGNDSLYAVSDASGWWNLYQVAAAAGATPVPLCPRAEEFAGPLWQLGSWSYGVLDDGRLATLHGTGETRLAILDPATGALEEVDGGYRTFGFSGIAVGGQVVVGVAGGPSTPMAVVRAGAGAGATEKWEILRQEESSTPPAYLPVPRQVELTAAPGEPVVHALAYPPTSPDAVAPEGERPPYLVWIHGGPTSHVLPLLDLEKAYFTSRGIGVIDVNYGGSTGYGRAYRERLRGQWGLVDVTDAMNAALALAAGGEADRARLGIRGGSAGGWTVLASVTSGLTAADGTPREPVFAAGASYFGVSDLKQFVHITHDFESRYLDGLVGPLPEAAALYDERSPLGHVGPGTCPVLLLQGLDDPIVPPPQAESIARDLAAHGIPHAYIAFAGESHGFRRAESIIAALEAELAFYGQVMGFEPPGVPPVKLER